jgi:hypothetical protein
MRCKGVIGYLVLLRMQGSGLIRIPQVGSPPLFIGPKSARFYYARISYRLFLEKPRTRHRWS